MRKVYRFHGPGLALGSTVIIVADDVAEAIKFYLTKMEEAGFTPRDVAPDEIRKLENGVVYFDNGDY